MNNKDVCPRCKGSSSWREYAPIVGPGILGDSALTGYEDAICYGPCKACNGERTASAAMRRKMEMLW